MSKGMEQSTDGGADVRPAPEIIDLPISPEVQPQQEPEPAAAAKAPEIGWPEFLKNATVPEVKDRFARKVSELLKQHGLGTACCLALIQPVDRINNFDLDQAFAALKQENPERDKDVTLFLLSSGGAGEPAYQISKLCKSFAKSKFTVVVPRFAKSAATLIAIGADEIHIGPLGQLGPIDPQIDGLPALGVSRALRTIASVAAQYPKSADMFAQYLRLALTVEQIGYCDRISESAVQYAERLLSTKPSLVQKAAAIAKELVHEYKDHAFVIDLDEAQQHLGSDWVKTGTNELEVAEALYDLFDMVNFFYGLTQSKRIFLSGGATSPLGVFVFDKKK